MDLTAMIEAATYEFKQKLHTVCNGEDLAELTPQVAEQVTQGLQEALAAAGVAALRTFLQACETTRPTVTVDHTLYRWKQVSEKTFLTPFGPMRLARNLYQADRGGPAYVPLDVHWGMVGEFATIEVREAVLFACAHVTPEETAQLLHKSAWFHPSPTAIKHMVEETGAWIEQQGDALHEQVRQGETIPEETQVVVASLDGVHVRLRQEGSKRGRPVERTGKPSNDITPTSAKQAMVGTLSCYGAVPQGEESPPRLNSRYVTHMPESCAPTFKRRFEEEVTHVDQQVDAAVQKVVLMDGARSLWHYVEQISLFDDYVPLVDFYHTTEHLAKAADALFGVGSLTGRHWYTEQYDRLLHQDEAPQHLLGSMEEHAQQRNLSWRKRQALETEQTFFRRNQHRMTYAAFRREGLPIGSGPVEAACKTLVKTRLGRSGMHWSWPGGQHILQLRTLVKSDRWEPFWNQYKLRYPQAA
jgi:hypothetical protein